MFNDNDFVTHQIRWEFDLGDLVEIIEEFFFAGGFGGDIPSGND